MCEKTELGDTCSGKLEEIMDLPSMSFQVTKLLQFFISILKKLTRTFSVVLYLGSNNLCWSCSHHVSPYNSLFNIHGFHEIYHSLSHLWMDANIIRFVKNLSKFLSLLSFVQFHSKFNKTWVFRNKFFLTARREINL